MHFVVCMYVCMHVYMYVCMPCYGSPSTVLQGELASVCTADSKLLLRPSDGSTSSVGLTHTRGSSSAENLNRKTGQKSVLDYARLCHRMYICMYVYIYIYMQVLCHRGHTYIYIHTYTHIHTYTQAVK